MTKLIYPEEGLVASQSKNMENAQVNLEKASQITLDIPNSFGSKADLNGIISNINNILKEHNKLQELLETTDINYQNVGNEIYNNFKVTDTIKVSKRDKII